jgi:hypothetical protein
MKKTLGSILAFSGILLLGAVVAGTDNFGTKVSALARATPLGLNSGGGGSLLGSPAPCPTDPDGVTLITQTCALSGDTAGFPISITAPGSYRLASNIVVPAGLSGFNITANNVTLDFGGFNVSSLSTATSEHVEGIVAEGISNIVVRNGSITGFHTGIDVIASTHMEVSHMIVDTQIASEVGIALAAGEAGTPADGLFLNNVLHGSVAVQCPSIIIGTGATGFSLGGTGCVQTDTAAFQ